MNAKKSYGWVDDVLLDLVRFAGLNNLQHTAGKLAEVYNLLQDERARKDALPGECIVFKSVTVSLSQENSADIDQLSNRF